MSTVGPELPPYLLAKRKRQQEDEPDPSCSPVSFATDSESAEKRQRILGPSLPPGPLDELPKSPLNDEAEDDSEDDFGPPLPAIDSAPVTAPDRHDNELDDSLLAEIPKKQQRDEWMLVPPKQDEWSSRVDPTKLRNRKFNTGKGAKAPPQKGSGDNTLWTETPEQKRQRLKDEVLGVKAPAQLGKDGNRPTKADAEARETQRKIQEYNVSFHCTWLQIDL